MKYHFSNGLEEVDDDVDDADETLDLEDIIPPPIETQLKGMTNTRGYG